MNLQSKLFLLLIFLVSAINAQDNPAINSWLQNTSQTGLYYVSGNSTAIPNNILVNCQLIEYSNDFVYVHTHGIPAYPSGPFLDGNPSIASDQDAIYKIPLNPVPNTGTLNSTVGGNIGVFVNGVSLFDFRDGVGWNSTTNSLCGGPGNPPCPGGPMASTAWSRDAILAEKPGFDCSKAHPAMGNYHHHQNPSAFNLDLNVVSTICNLYDADGLYAIDSMQHSPLIGFAYDGFPIYGAYGFKNSDGTGGVVRLKSGYQLRDISSRITSPTGESVSAGPVISSTYPLGYFREDYEFITHAGEEDYLDLHNGRLCVTPEYPEGIYCYFATVDENWNSAYPYVVGPTFYGNYANRKVTTVSEATTVFEPVVTATNSSIDVERQVKIFPNPASDLIAIQISGLNSENLSVDLYDLEGKLVNSTSLKAGSTIAYFDTRILYSGTYFVIVKGDTVSVSRKIIINKD
ncbi:MAG: YHYH protein [Bacteroidia bacterium]